MLCSLAYGVKVAADFDLSPQSLPARYVESKGTQASCNLSSGKRKREQERSEGCSPTCGR